jgi:hypothetical protein
MNLLLLSTLASCFSAAFCMQFVHRNDPFQALEAHLNVDSFFSDLVDILHQEEMEALAREMNFPSLLKSQIFREDEYYGLAKDRVPEFDYAAFVDEIDSKNRVLYPNFGHKEWHLLNVIGGCALFVSIVVAVVALRKTFLRAKSGALSEKSLNKSSY